MPLLPSEGSTTSAFIGAAEASSSASAAAVASIFAWMIIVYATGMPIIMRLVCPMILVAFVAREYTQTRDHGHGTNSAPGA